jgi:hypothetical protein
MPVDPSYSLLLAGRGLADQEHLCDTIQAMIVVRNEVGRSLRSIGATGDLSRAARGARPKRKGKTGRLISAPTEEGMEALLDEAEAQKIKPEDVDAFWDQAAEKHAGRSSRPDAIPYEEARKLGLTPDKE